MTDVYEESIDALRRYLLTRMDLVQRILGALKDEHSEYAEDHRRLARIYAALLRKLETEVAFEREIHKPQMRAYGVNL